MIMWCIVLLIQSNSNEHINPEDGTLILVRSLDRETQSLHHLLVMASFLAIFLASSATSSKK
jgi:hypothetical protein